MATIVTKFKEEVLPCPIDPAELILDRTCDDISDINVARIDKFLLVIDLPQCFNSIKVTKDVECSRNCSYIDQNRLQMNIYGNVIPDISVPKIDKPFGGQVVTVTSHSRPVYPPVTVNFTIDSNYDNYYVIYKWLDILNDDGLSCYDGKKQVRGSGHLPDYSTTFVVYALDEYNRKTARWDFYGAFPIALGSINYNKREEVEIESTFQFSFSFLKMSLGDNLKIL